MKSRILVAAVGVPLLLLLILWVPTAVLAAVVAAAAAIAGVELQQCVGGEKKGSIVVLSAIFPAVAVLFYFWLPEYITWLLAFEVFFWFSFAIFKGGEVKFNRIMAALFAGICIAFSFGAFLRMAQSGISRGYLLLPFILSFMSDTGGYFAGRAFGKHKLAPKVSPKKTVEGSGGGIMGNIIGGVIFVLVMDKWFGGGIGIGAMVILAVLCSAVAQIGDLSFSLIKREFGIKDYGKLFLEHGGVLDRFDSVLFVTPVIEIVLNFLQ